MHVRLSLLVSRSLAENSWAGWSLKHPKQHRHLESSSLRRSVHRTGARLPVWGGAIFLNALYLGERCRVLSLSRRFSRDRQVKARQRRSTPLSRWVTICRTVSRGRSLNPVLPIVEGSMLFEVLVFCSTLVRYLKKVRLGVNKEEGGCPGCVRHRLWGSMP